MADDKVKFLMRIDPDTDRKVKTAIPFQKREAHPRHTVSQLPKPERSSWRRLCSSIVTT